jgi:RnfABCDGE-type electron transport complex G subunit
MVEEKVGNAGEKAAASESAAPVPGGMPDWLRFPLVLAVVGALSALCLGGLYALTKEKIEESKSAKVWSAFASILRVPKATFEPQKDASGEVERYAMKDEKGAVVSVVRPVIDAKGKDAKGKDPKAVLYYAFADEAGKPTAYAAQVRCPNSYNAGDPIELIVVLSADLERVMGVRVVKSAETPGLGQRVKEPTAARSLVGIVTSRKDKKRVVLAGGGALVGDVERDETTGGERRSFTKDEVADVTEAPFPPAFLDLLSGVAVEKAKLRSAGGGVDALTGATISSRAVMAGVAEGARLLREALGRAE